MLRTLFLFTLTMTTLMAADGDYALEASAFGISHHTNRNFNWNEENWGAGLGIRTTLQGPLEWRLSGACYRDSMNKTAIAIVTGPGCVVGDRTGIHAGLELNIGYLDGSGFRGVGAIPVLSVGYGPVDLCMTASPARGASTKAATGPDDLEHGDSGMVGLFARVTLWTW